MKDKDQVREDIKSYEKYKKLKRTGEAGLLASAGLSGAAGAGLGLPMKARVPMAIGGIGGAIVSGVLHGKAKREEKASLGRIKRFYDLREKPDFKKVAVLGGAINALTGLGAAGAHMMFGTPLGDLAHAVQYGASHFAPAIAASVAGAVTPLAIDLALLPTLGKYIANRTREHAYAAAKSMMGKKLTPAEEILRASSLGALGKINQTKEMKSGPSKFLSSWWNQYKGPSATGGQMGEQAGDVLKQFNEFSPTLADAALGAIKDDSGKKKLFEELKKRQTAYGKAGETLNSAIDEVPFLRGFIRASGKSGKDTLKKMLENPEEAIAGAQKIKDAVKGAVRGAKFTGGTLALGGVSSFAASHRKRHPLAEDELPSRLTG